MFNGNMSATEKAIITFGIVATLFLGGLFVHNQFFQGGAPSIVTSSGVWYRSGSAMLLNPSTLTIGSASQDIANGYFTDINVSGTCTGCTGSVALDDLSDVAITSVGNGEILGYNSGWINRTLSEAGIAASGANSDITSLSGLSTALSVAQGGTGATSLTSNRLLTGNGTSAITAESNLFFDGTTFGISTSTPWGNSTKLNVYGGSIINDELATSSLATVVIDWTEGNQQQITMSQATQVEFSNVHDGAVLRLILCSDGTGRAITWNVSNVLWTGGTEPTETATANKCDLFTFVGSSGTSTPIILGASILNF